MAPNAATLVGPVGVHPTILHHTVRPGSLEDHAPAEIGRIIGAIRMSASDEEAVEPGIGDAMESDDVVGVLAPGHLALREIRIVIPEQVARQDGGVVYPVALVERRLGSGEAAVYSHAGGHLKRDRAIRVGGRLVRSGRHPDLVTGSGGGKGILQVGIGIRPRGTVVQPVGIMLDIAGRGLDMGRNQERDRGKKWCDETDARWLVHDQPLSSSAATKSRNLRT